VVRADGWFPSQPPASLVAAGRERMREIAAAEGITAHKDVAVNLFAVLGEDDAAAETVLADALGHRFADREALLESAIAGGPERYTARIEEYIRAGATAFDLKILPLDTAGTLRQMQRIATEVMPALAGAASGAG
jgi:alkanesulfonate monooxygenase SsuD/methylene tetrahydromethanopterin reductase-like flavin-dependent oxidoreductase (luciferase family)